MLYLVSNSMEKNANNEEGLSLLLDVFATIGDKLVAYIRLEENMVLATLLNNKLNPDPFYGLENEAIIDIGDSGREHYTFWYFNKFQCNQAVNQHVDLNFRVLNYSAEVHLNGHKITILKGVFRRHSLDVTDMLSPDGVKLLAVIVHPPDNPGKIPPTGGQGGDHEISSFLKSAYIFDSIKCIERHWRSKDILKGLGKCMLLAAEGIIWGKRMSSK